MLASTYTGLLAGAFVSGPIGTFAFNTFESQNITGGVEKGLEPLLDSYFGSIGASQLMQFNDSTSVSAIIEFNVVVLTLLILCNQSVLYSLVFV